MAKSIYSRLVLIFLALLCLLLSFSPALAQGDSCTVDLLENNQLGWIIDTLAEGFWQLGTGLNAVQNVEINQYQVNTHKVINEEITIVGVEFDRLVTGNIRVFNGGSEIANETITNDNAIGFEFLLPATGDLRILVESDNFFVITILTYCVQTATPTQTATASNTPIPPTPTSTPTITATPTSTGTPEPDCNFIDLDFEGGSLPFTLDTVNTTYAFTTLTSTNPGLYTHAGSGSWRITSSMGPGSDTYNAYFEYPITVGSGIRQIAAHAFGRSEHFEDGGHVWQVSRGYIRFKYEDGSLGDAVLFLYAPDDHWGGNASILTDIIDAADNPIVAVVIQINTTGTDTAPFPNEITKNDIDDVSILDCAFGVTPEPTHTPSPVPTIVLCLPLATPGAGTATVTPSPTSGAGTETPFPLPTCVPSTATSEATGTATGTPSPIPATGTPMPSPPPGGTLPSPGGGTPGGPGVVPTPDGGASGGGVFPTVEWSDPFGDSVSPCLVVPSVNFLSTNYTCGSYTFPSWPGFTIQVWVYFSYLVQNLIALWGAATCFFGSMFNYTLWFYNLIFIDYHWLVYLWCMMSEFLRLMGLLLSRIWNVVTNFLLVVMGDRSPPVLFLGATVSTVLDALAIVFSNVYIAAILAVIFGVMSFKVWLGIISNFTLGGGKDG